MHVCGYHCLSFHQMLIDTRYSTLHRRFTQLTCLPTFRCKLFCAYKMFACDATLSLKGRPMMGKIIVFYVWIKMQRTENADVVECHEKTDVLFPLCEYLCVDLCNVCWRWCCWFLWAIYCVISCLTYVLIFAYVLEMTADECTAQLDDECVVAFVVVVVVGGCNAPCFLYIILTLWTRDTGLSTHDNVVPWGTAILRFVHWYRCAVDKG